MTSPAIRLAKLFRVSSSSSTAPTSPAAVALRRSLRSWYSTASTNGGNGDELDQDFDDVLGEKPEMRLQGVDPKKGWGFRGVYKAIICGKIGQAPVQKILRNGRTVTVFTVGTGGLFDQRIIKQKGLPKPAQWHRIAVHDDTLGAYAVQQLAKDSSVYVEGDIETRVYNDSVSGQIKNIPEICVRRDGQVRLITSGNATAKDIDFEDLREGLFDSSSVK